MYVLVHLIQDLARKVNPTAALSRLALFLALVALQRTLLRRHRDMGVVVHIDVEAEDLFVVERHPVVGQLVIGPGEAEEGGHRELQLTVEVDGAGD